MDSIEYLRGEIKTYFPASTELRLSERFDTQPRFNFYFQIVEHSRYLLYLNWDGDGNRFTLKSLEFESAEVVNKLAADYPQIGSRVFNIGKPKSLVSFIYRGNGRLSGTLFTNTNSFEFDSGEMSGMDLMQCIDPAFGLGNLL